MREQIAEIINNAILTYHSPTYQPYEATKKILALFKDSELKWYNAGWEDCMKKLPSLNGISVQIRTKSGGRLRVKE